MARRNESWLSSLRHVHRRSGTPCTRPLRELAEGLVARRHRGRRAGVDRRSRLGAAEDPGLLDYAWCGGCRARELAGLVTCYRRRRASRRSSCSFIRSARALARAWRSFRRFSTRRAAACLRGSSCSSRPACRSSGLTPAPGRAPARWQGVTVVEDVERHRSGALRCFDVRRYGPVRRAGHDFSFTAASRLRAATLATTPAASASSVWSPRGRRTATPMRCTAAACTIRIPEMDASHAWMATLRRRHDPIHRRRGNRGADRPSCRRALRSPPRRVTTGLPIGSSSGCCSRSGPLRSCWPHSSRPSRGKGRRERSTCTCRSRSCFGGLLNALPVALILTRPGWIGTRYTIAIAQMLWSGVLIHLTGGRIETHFHVFGSLGVPRVLS